MDKKSSNTRQRRRQLRGLASTFFFLAAAAGLYGLSFRMFVSLDCEFGSKLAVVLIPACAVLGTQAAAVIPFAIACGSVVMACRSYKQCGG